MCGCACIKVYERTAALIRLHINFFVLLVILYLINSYYSTKELKGTKE